MSTYVPATPCKHGHYLRYVASGRCAECTRARAAVWKKDNPDRAREIASRYAARNRDKAVIRSRRWQVKNRDKVRAATSRWAKNNPARAVAAVRRREIAKLRRTPPWLTPEHHRQMAEFYERARRLTEDTGIVHQVDHIIPLQGRTVSGLHVPWNLQVITRVANIRKSNRLLA